jgi:hypothetical protein
VIAEEDLMNKPKYLTKSRFKLARSCVTKLHYSVDKSYANANDGNDFMKALAEGGYQVGELAKMYYPGGHDITEQDKDKALSQTHKLLTENENVILYEAAIKYNNLFIRADVLVKKGNQIDLIEVKAKSGDSDIDKLLIQKKESRKKDAPSIDMVNGDFSDYIYDIAFQTYVTERAFPEFQVHPYLMLADKAKVASVDGLNQFFLITEVNGRAQVKVKEGLKREDLGDQVLGLFDARPVVDLIFEGRDQGKHSRSELEMESFEQEIERYARVYEAGSPTYMPVSRNCKGCEFNCNEEGKKNGFNECWSRALNIAQKDLENDKMIFGIWNLHYTTTDKLLEQGKVFIKDLDRDDIEQGKPAKTKDRQWLQVENEQSFNPTPFLDVEGLSSVISNFKYPLHFIDFETSMVAIPFFKGQRPYEQVAFQFSHHVMHEDGTIEHKGEFISDKPGEFPNFNFVRALKKELEADNGTIFKFAPHENTVLCQIYWQLDQSLESDREELKAWIQTVTKYDKNGHQWEGDRNMIDMCALVKDYYWHPIMGGSNSIKVVLPAVLNSSKYLKDKYQFPIYGTTIKSHNFKDMQWIKLENDKVINPYVQLPHVFHGVNIKDEELITKAEKLKDGGAAMTAYARMQFCEMSPSEREALKNALLRYCELDTMAMVMIMEAWMDWCKRSATLKKAG